MEQNQPSISKLAEALAKAQGKIKTPVKNQTVRLEFSGGRSKEYKYADLASVIDAIREPLAENGLAYFHKMGNCETVFGMRTILVHSSGEKVDTWYPLPDPTKTKAQDFGSAMTYARRYSLSSLLGIASDDDDDGQGANNINGNNESKNNRQNREQNRGKSENIAPKNEQKNENVKILGQDFVMPFGDAGVKGSKLSSLNDVTLANILKYVSTELQKEPKPKNTAQLVTIKVNVESAIAARDAAKKENVNTETGEIDDIPENQSSPNYENESQESSPKAQGKEKKDDPADFIVPMSLDALGAFNGQPLKKTPEANLKAAIKELESIMQQVPPPPGISDLLVFTNIIKAFLRSVGAN